MLSSWAKRLWGGSTQEPSPDPPCTTDRTQHAEGPSGGGVAARPTTTCPEAEPPCERRAQPAPQHHELIDDAADLDRLRAQFVSQAGQAYGYGGRLDGILACEFQRLQGQVYLDHAGAGLYSEVELEASYQQLKSQLFTNPHSQALPGNPSTEAMARLRTLTLQLCNASGQEYQVVFTSGATSALKLVRVMGRSAAVVHGGGARQEGLGGGGGQ
jgi:hypothetical protein